MRRYKTNFDLELLSQNRLAFHIWLAHGGIVKGKDFQSNETSCDLGHRQARSDIEVDLFLALLELDIGEVLIFQTQNIYIYVL